MDGYAYTGFPTVQGLPPPQSSQTATTSFSGGGAISSGTVLNFGGSGGLSVAGNQGIWSGSQTFSLAPFSVTTGGVLVATGAKITGSISVNGIGNLSSVKLFNVSNLPVIGFYDTGNVEQAAIYLNSSATTLALQNANGSGMFFNYVTGNVSVVSQDASPTPIGQFSVNTASSNVQTTGNIAFQASTGPSFTGNFIWGAANSSLNSAGNLAVNGSFSASGTKAFDVEHPTKKGKRLRYVAVESPEVLVVCRGKGAFDKSKLPDHFSDVSEPGTTQVTQGTDPLNGGVSWVATAVRKGYADHQPEYVPAADDHRFAAAPPPDPETGHEKKAGAQ